MDLSEIIDNRYNYFLAVTSVGNFHKASEKIFVSQPAVSQKIQRLEKELGVPLLERSGGAVHLTPQGKVLHDSLQECQDILEEAFQRISRMHDEMIPKGPLKLGMLSNWDIDRLEEGFFPAYFARYPEVEPLMIRGSAQKITERLIAGTLDAAILPRQEIETTLGVSWVSLGMYPFMLILSRTHPMASYEDISDRLDAITLYTHQKIGRRAVLSRFEKTGHRPKIVITSNIESKIAAAESGLGGAVVLSCSSAVCDPSLKAYPLRGLESEIVFAYRPSSENPVVTSLIRLLSSRQMSGRFQQTGVF